LLDLQRSFADLIRRPLEAGDKMKDDPRIESLVEPNDRLSSQERLEVYAQQYWWRIRDSFDEDFCTLKFVLGVDRYREIRDQYLEEHPSISFTLRNLGSRLVAFLEGVKIDDKGVKASAIEAATYDWAKIVAFDAAENAPLTAANIQSRNFSRRILKLLSFVIPLSISFDLPSKTEGCDVEVDNGEFPRAKQGHEIRSCLNPLTRLGDESRFVILHRRGGRLFIKSSSRNEYFLLSSLVKGVSLVNIFSIMAAGMDVSEGEIYEFFESWVRMGWLYCENLSE